MKRGFTILELLAVIVIIALLVAVILPGIHRGGHHRGHMACMNNLRQLYTMQQNYRVTHGGKEKAMAHESGAAFWLKLTRTDPPLIDPSLRDIFFCTLKAHREGRNRDCDYRGPASDANFAADDDVIGADLVGNHGNGEGGNVLRASGDVHCVSESDVLWEIAARTTKP